MTGETVVSRLHAAVNAMPGPVPLERGLVLTLEDALTLNRLLISLCPEEQTCEECETRICETCGVGDMGGCDHGRVLCRGCDVEVCSECSEAFGLEEATYYATDGRLP